MDTDLQEMDMRNLTSTAAQKNSPNRPLAQTGFTLIELIIVVAVIGILASIAIPSYHDYIKRGKAAEATSNLATLRVKMEQHFQDNRTYENGPCEPVTGAQYFTYSCSVTPSATAYTLKATGIAAQGMADFEFTLDQSNAKTSKFDGTVGASCWLTKKGGTC